MRGESPSPFPCTLNFARDRFQHEFASYQELSEWLSKEQGFWQPYTAVGDQYSNFINQNVTLLLQNQTRNGEQGFLNTKDNFEARYLPSES
jgi:hypothetical protein